MQTWRQAAPESTSHLQAPNLSEPQFLTWNVETRAVPISEGPEGIACVCVCPRTCLALNAHHVSVSCCDCHRQHYSRCFPCYWSAPSPLSSYTESCCPARVNILVRVCVLWPNDCTLWDLIQTQGVLLSLSDSEGQIPSTCPHGLF